MVILRMVYTMVFILHMGNREGMTCTCIFVPFLYFCFFLIFLLSLLHTFFFIIFFFSFSFIRLLRFICIYAFSVHGGTMEGSLRLLLELLG